MSERAPASPGYKYNWLGQLREDPDYYPPPGYRLARNFITHKLELVSLYGSGVDGLDGGNAQPKPNLAGPSRNYSYATPDPSKFGQGILFTGENSQEPPPNSSRRAGQNRYNSSDSSGPAIF